MKGKSWVRSRVLTYKISVSDKSWGCPVSIYTILKFYFKKSLLNVIIKERSCDHECTGLFDGRVCKFKSSVP